ncbi:helix-hairpin-helix domain-containing protein [Promicromonospora sukumoe]|uniref:helix-hairpin-helix domain-containing protein n=1 Tax=Promicromonospora sukumoe TaxID=88382 RepID=UPI0003A639E6|nr:helix-hairpin-helix domain-containing protein [Promicromonospora sukumoe]
MGWFIAQSLAFIIIAALIGLAIGIWIGWLVWGRRKGKHTAEKSEAVGRANTAEGGTTADDAEAAGTDAEPVRVLAVAGAAGAATAVAAADEPGEQAGAGDAVDTKEGGAAGDAGAGEAAAEQAGAEAADEAGTAGPKADDESTAQAGEDEHAGADGSAVVAEAEAVAREAAEQAAAAKAAALAEAGDDAADETAVEAVVEPAAAAEPADDLQRIEGVGPKIAAALAAAGYTTYAKIAAATEDELRAAVAGQGIKFAPAASSWADQAQYLVDGDTAGFEEYQDYLVGGQERRAKFNENVDYTDVDEIEGAEAKAEAIAEDEAATAAAEQAEQAEAAGTVEAEPAEVTPEPEPEPEPQDLQRIEGIGPKIETALTAAGYTTYAKVAGASEDELRAALTASGINFAPAATSWADQAQYLVDGDEDGLREYQDYLIGGQERRAKFNENVDYTDVDEIEGTEAKAEALAEDEAEAAAAPEPVAEPEPTPEPEPEPQDLQRIEGIGPKIEATLKAAGYATYAKIAAATETELRAALATGGIKFAPAATSWADQAQYLADGDEDGLQEYQDYLIGGQDRHAKFRKDVDYTDVDEIEGTEAKAEAIAEDEAKVEAAEDDAEATGSEVKA